MNLYKKHEEAIEKAVCALDKRGFYAAFAEHPSAYDNNADVQGQVAFKALLGNRFEQLEQPDPVQWIGTEESPYTQEPLGIVYPAFRADELIGRAESTSETWRKTSIKNRAGVLAESLSQVKARFFEIAYAAMHTSGQAYMMAFQASGPHAADRAMEAIAASVVELQRVPCSVLWDKPMGKFNVKLHKTWTPVPKGIALVIGCSTFPVWNSVTGIYSSLMAGNPVIVKPHPKAILPIAIFVTTLQQSLKRAGLNPHLCQLAVDNEEQPITKTLAEHSAIKIIDYTGNDTFGNYLEKLSDKAVFTEKTGVNAVIVDGVKHLDKVAANIAFSISLYSGQMCTAPQNIYVPEGGIKDGDGNIVTFDDFAKKLAEHITALVDNPKAGPFVLGAIQNKKTYNLINEVKLLATKTWLDSKSVSHPFFANARIATPLLIEMNATNKKICREFFGPIALLIKVKDTQEAIRLAQTMAIKNGALSCAAYVTDKETKMHIADAMSLAATPVSFNLTGPIYMNQNAAFSDFHGTGGNPAANSSYVDSTYIAKRFTWVGHREPDHA